MLRLNMTLSALAAALILSVLSGGCRYASVERSKDEGDIHAFIEARLADSIVSFSGYQERPGAILFDLTDDPRPLGGMGWHKVADRTQVHALADAMAVAYRFWGKDAGGPRLSIILDPDRQPLGYIYSPVEDSAVIPSGDGFLVESISEAEIQKRANPGIRGAGG
ncbi:MAG: hypothetical protein COX16_14775 [Deltaproteobacteria bacterium CG23_combo_of_CG06-09_8_20_14_all_51_20]|nr:MAG: hypothetical protein COX16_14775 [Deltaproteobacteria bacterium CG23_combo_of_CG06-09_8_20_14_all_51_20]PIW01607.1 MAG: hypothetical protein COW41_02125 [Deltaproteobacteria bacterium CG17_big_fil_post_rev_8_21_14_2_50_51_6]PJB33407.1 MAG: hypothetical protein CO107_15590 [Deltaproteobacteria bacterium CG_4_9_14_3_um_filter_51_14]